MVCKKSRQIKMRQILTSQILISFSEDMNYEKFVKTMSSNFRSSSSSKEAKISRQMNRSQKLKRKKTCIRHIQPHRCHPGL